MFTLDFYAQRNFDQGGININIQPTITPTGTSNALPIGPTVDWDVDFGNPLDRDSGGRGGRQEGNRDTDNWWSNVNTAAQLFYEWDQGIGNTKRVFVNNRVANAFRNAWRVNEARASFYKKYKGVTDLTEASYTNVRGDFGLEGLLRAGVDPIEQFIGSYRIDIYARTNGTLEFNLTNRTHMNSFLYGLGPSWERSTFRLNGTTEQIYIFTELLNYARLEL